MRQFYCQCGQPVFFDSEHCVSCGSRLGFDRATVAMRALSEADDGIWYSDGEAFRLCQNGIDFDVCNWLVPAQDEQSLCQACRFNRTVPNQSNPGNQQRWKVLETAKKRLFYTLMRLGLPLVNGWESPDRGLLLDFIEDERSNEAYPESFVNTGYLGGVITINALEADDVAREMQRTNMNENYRTVLGHLRHESGHYYWHLLNPDPSARDEFTELFGDETTDYKAALEHYYRDGPRPNWAHSYISPYASAHPAEDWAESWGHYLHIYDALETAAAHGISDHWPDAMSIEERIESWQQLSVSLNELNRSVGLRDAYPFVLTEAVGRKLAFIDRVIAMLRSGRD